MTVSIDPSKTNADFIKEMREKMSCLADSIESCAEVNYWRIPKALAEKISAVRDLIDKSKLYH